MTILGESTGFPTGHTLAGAMASIYQWALGNKFPRRLEGTAGLKMCLQDSDSGEQASLFSCQVWLEKSLHCQLLIPALLRPAEPQALSENRTGSGAHWRGTSMLSTQSCHLPCSPLQPHSSAPFLSLTSMSGGRGRF